MNPNSAEISMPAKEWEGPGRSAGACVCGKKLPPFHNERHGIKLDVMHLACLGCKEYMNRLSLFVQGFALCQVLRCLLLSRCDVNKPKPSANAVQPSEADTTRGAKLDAVQPCSSASKSLKTGSYLDENVQHTDNENGVAGLEAEQPASSVTKPPSEVSAVECTAAHETYRTLKGEAVNEAKLVRKEVFQMYDCLGTEYRKNDSANDAVSAELKMNSAVASLICRDCGKVFTSRRSYYTHKRQQHPKAGQSCKICGKRCFASFGLTLHMHRVHKEERPYECKKCDEKFTNFQHMQQHNDSVHKEETQCHICGKHLKSKDTLRCHIKAHTTAATRPYVCEICGKNFIRGTNLQEHRVAVHKIPSRGRSATCVVCNSYFPNRRLLRIHMNSHKDYRPYKCDVCEKDFTNSECLNLHKQQHKEKRFVCDVCGKLFTYKANMKEHYLVHIKSAQKHNECEICHKIFESHRSLSAHMRQHLTSEDRKFFCIVCAAKFTRKSSLRRHLKDIHRVNLSDVDRTGILIT